MVDPLLTSPNCREFALMYALRRANVQMAVNAQYRGRNQPSKRYSSSHGNRHGLCIPRAGSLLIGPGVQLSSDLTLREFWDTFHEYWDAVYARGTTQKVVADLIRPWILAVKRPTLVGRQAGIWGAGWYLARLLYTLAGEAVLQR